MLETLQQGQTAQSFMQSDPYRQTENFLIRRSSLLDGGHLYSMGDLAKGWGEGEEGKWVSATD